MGVKNVLYNPINRAGLNCGPDFSEQKVVFGGIGCEGIKIIKGSETKTLLPMDFTVPSTAYIRNEFNLPKFQNINNKITIPSGGYNFLALTVFYEQGSIESQRLVRGGFVEDFSFSLQFPIYKTFMINSPANSPLSDFYIFNPSPYTVTINYLVSKY